MADVFFTHIKEDILEPLADISEGRLNLVHSHEALTCLKSAIETKGQRVKFLKS